jgi:hypothetical protein
MISASQAAFQHRDGRLATVGLPSRQVLAARC